MQENAGQSEDSHAEGDQEKSNGTVNLVASGVVLLLLASGAALFILSAIAIGKSAQTDIAAAIGAGLGLAGMSVAGWLVVYREAQRRHARVLLRLPTLLRDLDRNLAALESVRREHAKLNMSLKGVREGLTEDSRAAQHQREELVGAGDGVRRELGEFRRELIEIRQRMEEDREARLQVDAVLVEVADSIFRRLDLDGFPALLDDYSRQLQALGLDLIHPAPASPINDRLHTIEDERDEDGIPPLCVVKCLAPGFRRGSTVLRAASVVVTPEAPAPADTDAGSSGDSSDIEEQSGDEERSEGSGSDDGPAE